MASAVVMAGKSKQAAHLTCAARNVETIRRLAAAAPVDQTEDRQTQTNTKQRGRLRYTI